MASLLKKRKYCNSHFYYTRSHVSYSRTGCKLIKHILNDRTCVCCKRLGWFL